MFFLNSTVNEIRSKKLGVKAMSSMGFDPFQNRLIALSSLGVFYTINCINQTDYRSKWVAGSTYCFDRKKAQKRQDIFFE